MDLHYRRCDIKDLEKLVEVSVNTFDDTFRDYIAGENMKAYMDSAFTSNKLTIELENEESEFYFVYLNDSVAGYFKINGAGAQTELNDKSSLELERFYLLKEFRGRNFGEQILERVLSIAREKKLKYIWLGVWEKNYRALKFYRKHGFIRFGEHLFIMGDDKQVDYLMKRDL
jgi:ribosomal protein S18 acetylase RimI-like enzyme